MSVRAKFQVVSKTSHLSHVQLPDGSYGQGEMVTIGLAPVGPKYEGNKIVDSENTKFWHASPSGRIELGTINSAAAAGFELGKSYYVDFTPAE